MVNDPKQLQDILRLAAPPDLPVLFRPMFGGIMAYADGKPFASFSDVGLALKFAGEHRAALLAEAGAVALRYAADQPPSKSYVVGPDAIRLDPQALGTWVQRSIANLPPAKLRRSKA